MATIPTSSQQLQSLTQYVQQLDSVIYHSYSVNDLHEFIDFFETNLSYELESSIKDFHSLIKLLLPYRPFNEQQLQRISNHSLITSPSIEYIETLLQKTNNPILKAHFSHFLWFLLQNRIHVFEKGKKYKFALCARKSYEEAALLYINAALSDKTKFLGMYISDFFKNSYFFYVQTGNKQEEIKQFKDVLFHHLLSFPFDSESHFILFKELSYFLIENRSKDSNETNKFKQINFLCQNLNNSYHSKGLYHQATAFCEIGIKLKTISCNFGVNWELEKAKNFEKQKQYLNAAFLYKENKKLNLCENMLKKYEEENHQTSFAPLKSNGIFVQYATAFRAEYDLWTQILFDHYSVEQILDLFAYNFITTNTSGKIETFELDLLSKDKNVEEKDYINQQATLFSMIPKISTDFKGNAIKNHNNAAELDFTMYQNYGENMMHFLYLFNEIMQKAVQKGTVNKQIVMNYLQNKAWFAQTVSIPVPNQQFFTHNFLELIEPNIEWYFMQKANKTNQYSMIIESLSVQFERLFREMLRQLGKTTITVKEDENGQFYTTEKDITALLRNKTVMNFLSEDDWFFFNYVLIEKAGFNLRHDVAHSLKLAPMYKEYEADVLVIALLKLIKYVPNNQSYLLQL